jgi:ferredoxin-NADP reductase
LTSFRKQLRGHDLLFDRIWHTGVNTMVLDNSPKPVEQQPLSGTSDWNRFGKYRSRILHREQIARNVHLYTLEKPEGFSFRPGQAIEMSIDQPEWRDAKRPFTITSLPENPRLELMIKSYPVASNPDHEGMTEYLGSQIKVNDRVLFDDAWGAIEFRGPGVFIAGGAGITPFIAILRHLEQQGELAGNRLFFSNKTSEDVFLQGEFVRMLGRAAVFTLTQEAHRDYDRGRIDRKWLQSRVDNFEQPFYLCGPPPMVEEISETLKSLGANPDGLVFEADN